MEIYNDLFHSGLFLKFLVALVALLNPLYGIPIFLGMTQGYTSAERTRTANVIALSVFIIAVVVTLVGEEILSFFGVDVPAFQIAGGLIVLGIGMAMLNSDPPKEGDVKAHEHGKTKKGSIAIVPLSIPLTIGPGGIATIILFAHLASDWAEITNMIPAIFLICLLQWFGLYFADPISRTLGETTISITTRIMALILTAVAVEMIVRGAAKSYQLHFVPLLSGSS